jgi:hypothetical protein
MAEGAFRESSRQGRRNGVDVLALRYCPAQIGARIPPGRPLVRQDAHDFSLNSFTHAYPDVINGRFEAAPESKVKNAKQIVLYALGFLCLSQKLSGKIFQSLPFLRVSMLSQCTYHQVYE